MVGLCGLSLHVRVPWLIGDDLGESQGVNPLEVLVGIVETLEFHIQGCQAQVLVPEPLFVGDLDPKETAHSVLEGSKVTCVHSINRQVVNEQARRSEQVAGLCRLSDT